MKIELINKNWLVKLESLFSKSFGDKILIQDEIEYFEKEKPQNWFVAINQENQPIGFIRCFPLNSSNYFIAEVYADDLNVIKNLIEKFDNNLKNISIQFRIKETKQKLIDYLKDLGYIFKIEEFREYVFLQNSLNKKSKSIMFGKNEKKDIVEIIETLKELKYHSESEIIRFIEENKIIVYKKDNEIIGVSLNNINEKFIEIVEIVIKDKFRRKGFGKELLEGTMQLYLNKYPEIIFKLKVDKKNIAAIKLYEKVGFKEVKENRELWLTKKYK